MNTYLELQKKNILTKVKPLIRNNYLWVGDDGLVHFNREKTDADTGWIFQGPGHESEYNCVLYHRVYFPYLKFIHSQCLRCWKVVAAPATVVDLFAIQKLQEELGLWGKCGTEGNRENSDKLYGAYWYNPTLQDGLACYKLVSQAIADKGINAPTILKRGCTEFEQEIGASNEWTQTDEQKELEAICDQYFDTRPVYTVQHELTKEAIKVRWIHGAYQWGDKTYLELTEGAPLFRTLVTYHDKSEEWLAANIVDAPGGTEIRRLKVVSLNPD